ncbi:calcium-binding protein, partial [Lyngbya sp. CCY1209]|nr:calcium-binding protein [Lyngbya sp. CCY1209]
MPEQVIRTNPLSLSVAENSPFSFGVTYETANPVNNTLNGLTLRLHFDSEAIDFGAVENLESFDVFVTNPSENSENQSGVDDGDPNTDSYIVIGWISQNPVWPGDDQTYPVTLYNANFTTLDGFTGTTINFTSSDNPSEDGVVYELDAQSLTLNLAQAGITVDPTTGLTTTEAGGTDTFTVVLTSQPSANVTIPIASSDATEGTADVTELVFTPD